jgi:hypothetical protein
MKILKRPKPRKYREMKKLKELPKIQNIEKITEEIVRILNKVRDDHMQIRKNCKGLGLEDKTIDAMIDGKDIKECNYCRTYNMCEIFYNKKEGWAMYECYHCQKTYMLTDEEKNETEIRDNNPGRV